MRRYIFASRLTDYWEIWNGIVTLSRWKLEAEELRALVNREPKFLYFGVTADLFAFSL